MIYLVNQIVFVSCTLIPRSISTRVDDYVNSANCRYFFLDYKSQCEMQIMVRCILMTSILSKVSDNKLETVEDYSPEGLFNIMLVIVTRMRLLKVLLLL